MAKLHRYREEDGVPCVDVTVSSVERLFDSRDPAPFRERDLDKDLVEYLRGASEDLLGRPRVKVIFWIESSADAGELAAAYRAHFEYEIERIVRQRARHRRAGLVSLPLAIVLIVALLAVAQVVELRLEGMIGSALHEGLVIACWVLMWRPIDNLVYEWIPRRRDRAVMQRLRDAVLEVRTGRGPDGEHTVRHAVEPEP